MKKSKFRVDEHFCFLLFRKKKSTTMMSLNENDRRNIQQLLDQRGFAHIPTVLSQEECDEIKSLYHQEDLFRSTIDMRRYRFGLGQYKYFSYPLPGFIESLRRAFYPALVPVANDWMEKLNMDIRYPDDLDAFLSLCHRAGQSRPTPLILRYEDDGYNTLHQDLYGDVYFPFQVVIMLARPGIDFEGGELVFVEQLPRAQSRAQVLNPAQGEAVIFTTNFRPVKGSKGFYRARMKHGVSSVKSGIRYTTGVIFHDAN